MKMIQVVIKGQGKYQLLEGKTIYSILKDNGIMDHAHCGGNGTCGKCAVRFIMGAPAPKPHDRKIFSPQQLRDGFRLACITKPVQDCIIECVSAEDEEFVLTEHEFIGADDAQVVSQVVATQSPEDFGQVHVVCDLGTTTIVVQLIETETGKVIDTYTAMNPQRRFGADVITRMQKAMQGDAQLLSECVRYCIESGVSKWLAVGFMPAQIVISANTVMTHLFMQMDVAGLSVYPFEPVTTDEVTSEMEPEGIPITFLPAFSAFVGGDLMAGALVCKEDMEQKKLDSALLIDLGTNGELILMHKGKLYCSATAAGPAFEGGATANVPGSDMIKIVARLLEKGIIDETGLFLDQHFHSGITIDSVYMRQEDVRSLQIAKAAIYAGIQILLEKADVSMDQIQCVYLAGGFGYKVDVQAAARIGLLPEELVDKTVAVGNTSLAGAKRYAKALLEGKEEKIDDDIMEWIRQVREEANIINLAQEPSFETTYVEAMNF